ncbi:MAG: dienelactone hydrolase family protein [Acidobacteriota bacterium]
MIERTIAVGTHGRYLIEPPTVPGPAPVLVGFHGYGESADAQLERLRRMPGADRWRLVSIQGLHRFYQRRADAVVASWMTRQDRELAMDDNLAYVAAVLAAVDRDFPGAPRLVLAGFSQGVAMTFRAAAACSRRVDGVIAVGGDVPPELETAAVSRVRHAMVCHGRQDEWYTQVMFERDISRLREANVKVQLVEFDGGHQWSDEVVQAASVFLRDRLLDPGDV